MTAVWMLYATALGALIGLAALALEKAGRSLRPRSTAARWIWAIALVATVAAVTAGAPRNAVRASFARLRSRTLNSALAATALDFPRAETPALDHALLVAWLVASLGLVGWSARSLMALRARRRTWIDATLSGTSVWLSPDMGPAVVGVIRPQIVLPQWTLSLDDRSLGFMLAHETEHRLAHDPLLLAAAGLFTVLMPWNAALWWQLSRLRLAVEIDCDARVLGAAGSAREYAALLVSAAERMSGFTHFAPALAERPSRLERRIVAMSDAQRSGRVMRTLISAGAAVLCIALACESPRPSAVDRRTLTAGPAAPASLRVSNVAQQQFYPRVSRIDTVDAPAVEWLRLNVAKYYPSIVAGDTSFLFVSLYVDQGGHVVRAAARSARGVADRNGLGFLYTEAPFSYGGNGPADAGALVAEKGVYAADRDTLFNSQNPAHSVFGLRTVLPRTVAYDSTRGTSVFDPFLGADPRAFERDDDLYLIPGMVGPASVHVHVLTLTAGRGGPSDFGHQTFVSPESAADAADIRPSVPTDAEGRPAAGWILTNQDWDTLTHRPVILVDGARSTFARIVAPNFADSIESVHKVSPADARKVTNEAEAVNGAIVVTTRGHDAAKPHRR